MMSIPNIDKVIYMARARTKGGHHGSSSRTSDGPLDFELSVPGLPGTGTNPEEFFAAGWSACFLSAIKIEAASLPANLLMKVRLPEDVAVGPEVGLGTTDGGNFMQDRLKDTT